MEHMLHNDNLGLMIKKKIEIGNFAHAMIYTGVTESHAVSLKEINYLFPLYLYPNQANGIFTEVKRKPNLNQEIVKQIAEKLGLTFTNEKEETKNTFAPVDVLDYIYAVLHSPTYRDKYKEFLKIDFSKNSFSKRWENVLGNS